MKRDRLLVAALAVVGVVCIVAGIAIWHPAAGLVATGAAILAILTFDPDQVRRLRWPR